MTSSSRSSSISRSDARLGLHHLADDFDRSLQHLFQIARIGQHHRHVVNRRQLVDPLAKLKFLVAQPRDGIGQQK